MTDLLSKPATAGRHRALTPAEEQKARADALSRVPVDVRAAVARAVSEEGAEFVEEDWGFSKATFFGWVARVNRPGDGLPGQVLAVTADCRTEWVPTGEDPVAVLSRLEHQTPVSRSQIEFLLSERNRFYRGVWQVVPVDEVGWLCTRRGWFGRERHYVVSRNHRVLRVQDPDVRLAAATLRVLVTEPDSTEPDSTGPDSTGPDAG